MGEIFGDPTKRICDKCKKIYPMWEVRPLFDWRDHKKLGYFCRNCREEIKKQISEEWLAERKGYDESIEHYMITHKFDDRKKFFGKVYPLLTDENSKKFLAKFFSDLDKIKEEKGEKEAELEYRKFLDDFKKFVISRDELDISGLENFLASQYAITKVLEMEISTEALTREGQIMQLIKGGRDTAEEISSELAIGIEQTRRYLRELEEKKRIKAEKVGTRKIYKIIE
jgi:hypothetical protein